MRVRFNYRVDFVSQSLWQLRGSTQGHRLTLVGKPLFHVSSIADVPCGITRNLVDKCASHNVWNLQYAFPVYYIRMSTKLRTPRFKTRRLPAFLDSRGIRVTVRYEYETGTLLFSRWSRLILKATLPEVFALGSAPEEFRRALAQGDESAKRIVVEMARASKAAIEVKEATAEVIREAQKAATASREAYQSCFPWTLEVKGGGVPE